MYCICQFFGYHFIIPTYCVIFSCVVFILLAAMVAPKPKIFPSRSVHRPIIMVAFCLAYLTQWPRDSPASTLASPSITILPLSKTSNDNCVKYYYLYHLLSLVWRESCCFNNRLEVVPSPNDNLRFSFF